MRTGVIIVPLVSPETVGIACRALYSYNCYWLTMVPTAPNLYHRNLKYLREPPQLDLINPHERWYTYEEMLVRGGGDCKVLACASAAWRTVRMHQDAWPIVRRYKDTYHIVTGYLNGWGVLQIEDPSCQFGMDGCDTNGQVLAPYLPYK